VCLVFRVVTAAGLAAALAQSVPPPIDFGALGGTVDGTVTANRATATPTLSVVGHEPDNGFGDGASAPSEQLVRRVASRG
jgi:hypothetical protein